MSDQQLAVFADDHGRPEYDVRPRALVGPGDARHVTHALAAAGWTSHADPLAPSVLLTSPDRQNDLFLAPLSHTDICWRVLAAPPGGPAWFAELGRMVPVEIAAGLTDALTTPPRRVRRTPTSGRCSPLRAGPAPCTGMAPPGPAPPTGS
ncbi:DUF317 domain-containing protein [Streptomyces sp. NBC_00690]|uniref:DUF317 domain-containing protein n=1 Tax=Streptomyces sp. NBC_00690 TaxID=2975808 RepID=UPI002E2865B6|nr:DUF317 domain-containing protein [Streptomyces sp. NBC_00690]